MKSAGKIILAIAFISGLLLLYVHGQVSLLEVSYSIDERAGILAQKSEEFRHLKFEVDQLKAPRLLEEELKRHDFDLTLPKEIRVLRIPPAPYSEVPGVSGVPPSAASEGLFQIVGRLVGVAQAKTES